MGTKTYRGECYLDQNTTPSGQMAVRDLGSDPKNSCLVGGYLVTWGTFCVGLFLLSAGLGLGFRMWTPWVGDKVGKRRSKRFRRRK